jgi:hypothetical protein
MAVIKNADDLLRAFPNGFDATDFKGELARNGHSLSRELELEFADKQARYRAKAGPQKLQRWAELRSRSGSLRAVKQQPALTSKLKAPGDFDVIAAVRLPQVDQVLSGLLAARTIPWAIDAGRSLSADQLRQAMLLFRGGFTGIPTGAAVSLGKLNLLEVLPTRPIAGTDQVLLTVRVSLDFVVPTGLVKGPRERVVASLLGTITITVTARADIDFSGEPSMVIRVALPDTGQFLALKTAPESAIQPQTPTSEAAVAFFLAIALKESLGEALPSFAMSPVIKLPKLADTTVVVQEIQVRAREEDGGSLVVGVLITPRPGNPDRLVSPFGVKGGNLYLRIHEDLLKEAVRRAKESGELERLAREEDDDLRIDSADVEFRKNQIRFLLKGRVVDACALVIDAHWDAHVDVNYKVEGNKLTIEWKGDASPDWSNPKTYLCILVMLAAAVVGAVIIGLLLSPAVVAIIGVLLAIDNFSTLKIIVLGKQFDGNSVVTVTVPVPRTELLPRLAPVALVTASGAQEAWYDLTLEPDRINTHVYAQVNAHGDFPFRTVRPLSGLKVKLMDQDAPRPAGDDSVVPPTGERIIGENKKLIITEVVQFTAPLADQVLGEVTTTSEGIAHFMVTPGQFHTGAGVVTTSRITEHLDTGKTDIRTSIRQLSEARPDLYFLVLLAGGAAQVDSRNQGRGLMLNTPAGDVGAPGAPIEVVVQDGPVIKG